MCPVCLWTRHSVICAYLISCQFSCIFRSYLWLLQACFRPSDFLLQCSHVTPPNEVWPDLCMSLVWVSKALYEVACVPMSSCRSPHWWWCCSPRINLKLNVLSFNSHWCIVGHTRVPHLCPLQTGWMRMCVRLSLWGFLFFILSLIFSIPAFFCKVL